MKSEVGTLTSVNSTVAHSMGLAPVAGIFLGGTTAPNTTIGGSIGFSMAFSTFGGSAGDRGVAWGAAAVASTMRVYSTASNGMQIPGNATTSFQTNRNFTSASTASF